MLTIRSVLAESFLHIYYCNSSLEGFQLSFSNERSKTIRFLPPDGLKAAKSAAKDFSHRNSEINGIL
jgi:hypothetical protein